MFVREFFILTYLIYPTLLRAEPELRSKFASNCLIHNKAFRYEYLYSSNDTNRKSTAKKTDHLIQLMKVNDFNTIRWSFIETRNHSGQYYLKSSHYGDFLCATSKFADFFHLKRIVTRLRLNIKYDLSDNCKWFMKKVHSRTLFNTYYMINAHFHQPLYADSYFFQQKIHQREIFLYNKKYFAPENFQWMIDCKSGDYLWI